MLRPEQTKPEVVTVAGTAVGARAGEVEGIALRKWRSLLSVRQYICLTESVSTTHSRR